MLLQQEEARRQAIEQRARQATLPVQQQATFASTVHAAVLREPGKLNSRRFARREAVRHAAALWGTCFSPLRAGRLLSLIAVALVAHREAPLHKRSSPGSPGGCSLCVDGVLKRAEPQRAAGTTRPRPGWRRQRPASPATGARRRRTWPRSWRKSARSSSCRPAALPARHCTNNTRLGLAVGVPLTSGACAVRGAAACSAV